MVGAPVRVNAFRPTFALQALPDQFVVRVGIAEAGNDVDLLAERSDVIGRRKNAAGEQFAILIARRDHVLLRRLVHRQDILVLVDDGVADDEHAVVRDALDQFAELIRARRPRAACRGARGYAARIH